MKIYQEYAFSTSTIPATPNLTAPHRSLIPPTHTHTMLGEKKHKIKL